MGAIGERGMLIETNLVRRSLAATRPAAFIDHYHQERNHQGKDNLLLSCT
jgi:hypothetical protein